jgi:hypothetical protein
MADISLPSRSRGGSGGRGGGIKLPSVRDVQTVNPAAARDPGVRMTPAAFGAVQDPTAAGRALAEVAKVGTEYAKFEDRREQREAQLWQLKSLSEARNQWSTTLSEMGAAAEEGAPGFEKNVETAFDKYSTEALANAPERIRDEYGVRLGMLKGGLLEKAGDFARTSRVNKNVRDYERGTDADTNTVLNDPSQFKSTLDLRLGILNEMEIPADKRAILQRSAETTLSEAALSGRITVMKDPRGALASLNSGEWDKLLEPNKKLALIRLAEMTSAVSKADANAMLRDHTASLRATGVGVPGTVDKVMSAYDAKDMPRILADIDLAKRFHNSYQQLAYAQPGDMVKTLESFKPKPGQTNFADQQRDFEDLRNAAQHLMQRRADDPYGYAASMPQVQALTKEATGPDAARAVVRANLAGQEALGIPKVQQRVLGKAQAQGMVADLMSKPPADRSAALLQMQDTYKDQFPDVMRDLSDKNFNGMGLDPRTMVLASVAGNPALSQQMATVLQAGSKQLRDGLLPADVSATEKAVRTALTPWTRTVQAGAFGAEREPMLNGIAAAVEDLAISYVRNGEDPTTAAKRASDAVINDRYTVQDSYYIPKDAPDGIPYQPGNIDGFLRKQTTREALEAAGVRPFGSGPSIRPTQEGELPFGVKQRTKLYPGEDEFFRANPKTSGMAADDEAVILNPYSGLSPQESQAVARNEAARVHMRKKDLTPTFDVTPEQRSQFKGTVYEKDERALRQTIAARIFSGDPSAKDATPEQRAFVARNLTDVLPPNLELERERTLRTAINSGYWVTNANGTGTYLMLPFRGGGALPAVRADGSRYEYSFREASDKGAPRFGVDTSPEMRASP